MKWERESNTLRPILRRVDGVIRFEKAAQNKNSPAFDDLKIDEEEIVQPFVKGGVNVPGKPLPAN